MIERMKTVSYHFQYGQASMDVASLLEYPHNEVLVLCANVIGDPLQEQYGTLKHASILHRHGERSPLSAYPRDPHKEYHWLHGYGQLQNAGKRRMVGVGSWFRMRYQNFISPGYKPEHVRFESSCMRRCVMSALCFLYGFYPTFGEEIWMENEVWQPIPLYPIPKHEDNKLFQSKKCKLLSVLEKEKAKDPKYAVTYDEYVNTIQFILKNTGINVTKETKSQLFASLGGILDTLIVEDGNNLTLPDWAKKVYPEPLRTITSKTVHNFVFNTQTARLKAGPFLKSVIKDMKRKITDEKYEGKLHVYSAHDSTLWNVMTGLKVYDNVLPAYGSSLILELREKNSANYVTISYRNDTSATNARLLNVPGCGLTCTFEQFHDSIKPIIPENWEHECDADLPAELVVASLFIYVLMRISLIPGGMIGLQEDGVHIMEFMQLLDDKTRDGLLLKRSV